MNDKPKNGNLKVILWLAGTITTLVLFIGFPTLVNHVVANDKLRASEDIRISGEVDTKIEKVENRVVKRLDDFQKEQRVQGKEISGLRADSKNNVETLARIEAKL